MKIIKLYIAVQIALIVCFCISGTHLVKALRSGGENKHIQNVVKFSENSANALDAFTQNLKTADEMIPHLAKQSDNMYNVLKTLKYFTIKIPGVNFRPFIKNDSILSGMETFNKISKILKDYREKTSPALQASIVNASTELRNTKKLLTDAPENYTPHIIVVIGCIAMMLISNALIMIMFCKKIQENNTVANPD